MIWKKVEKISKLNSFSIQNTNSWIKILQNLEKISLWKFTFEIQNNKAMKISR